MTLFKRLLKLLFGKGIGKGNEAKNAGRRNGKIEEGEMVVLKTT